VKHTKIEWATHTFNPWVGCTKVSPACDHCYAENLMDSRLHVVQWGPGQPRRRTKARTWNDPVRWNEEAQGTGVRPRVFCASLADVFDNEVPVEWRHDLFELISVTPNLDWLLLTKRIGNVSKMINGIAEAPRLGSHEGDLMAHRWRKGDVPRNVWLGATICTQEEAARDVPKLLATPAAKRFVSMEPLLGPVDLARIRVDTSPTLGRWMDALRGHTWDESAYAADGAPLDSDPPDLDRLDWVIVGGESGPQARPMRPQWARDLRDQCAAADVPFLFKQWGDWGPDWEGAETCGSCGRTKFIAINERGECGHCGSADWIAAAKPLETLRHVGKKMAGRLLDGRTWDGVPT
jgi:protein gp37